jgi:cytochrome c peroxidase
LIKKSIFVIHFKNFLVMTKKILIGLLSFTTLGFYACDQTLSQEEANQVVQSRPKVEELNKSYNYSRVAVPKGFELQSNLLRVDDPSQGNLFTQIVNAGQTLEIQSVTDAKAKLGRVLFYDPKLSINNKISCGSCHHQDKAFADGERVSMGFEGAVTSRNSMAIINPAMSHSGLFWDRRKSSPRELSLQPVVNHIEMGMEDLKLLEIKLSGIDYYPQLFTEAYGNPMITRDKISDAMAAFMRAMITWDSKFDAGLKIGFSNFNAEEKHGMELFLGKQQDINGNVFHIEEGLCGGCHSAPMFNDGRSQFSNISAYTDNSTGNGLGVNIGLDKVSKDKGTGDGSFKIPSLRNVELTAPYMHDGRFSTLEEVVEHYNSKVQPAANLHSRLRDENGKPKKLNLSEADKKALIAFMKTLTDKQFIQDPKFSDPFKN